MSDTTAVASGLVCTSFNHMGYAHGIVTSVLLFIASFMLAVTPR